MAGRKPTYFVISRAGLISPLMPRREARDNAQRQSHAAAGGTVSVYQFDSAGSCAVEIGRSGRYGFCWHKKPKPVPAILAATIAAHFNISTEPGPVEMSKSGAE